MGLTVYVVGALTGSTAHVLGSVDLSGRLADTDVMQKDSFPHFLTSLRECSKSRVVGFVSGPQSGQGAVSGVLAFHRTKVGAAQGRPGHRVFCYWVLSERGLCSLGQTGKSGF